MEHDNKQAENYSGEWLWRIVGIVGCKCQCSLHFHPLSELFSQTTLWIRLKYLNNYEVLFFTYIHGAREMNPNGSGDPLTTSIFKWNVSATVAFTDKLCSLFFELNCSNICDPLMFRLVHYAAIVCCYANMLAFSSRLSSETQTLFWKCTTHG